jgi:hypothetical protein
VDADFLLEGASAKELEQSSKRLRSPPPYVEESQERSIQDDATVSAICYILPHWECLGIIPPFCSPC